MPETERDLTCPACGEEGAKDGTVYAECTGDCRVERFVWRWSARGAGDWDEDE